MNLLRVLFKYTVYGLYIQSEQRYTEDQEPVQEEGKCEVRASGARVLNDSLRQRSALAQAVLEGGWTRRMDKPETCTNCHTRLHTLEVSGLYRGEKLDCHVCG